MGRSKWVALGAVMATLAGSPAALAQDAGAQDAGAQDAGGQTAGAQDAASPAVQAGAPAGVGKGATAKASKPAKRPKIAKAPRAGHKPAAAAQATAPSEAYQLVPPPSGSALVRARQNSFGVRDEEGSSSGVRSRHIGIGLGGGNGMTPGMAIGF